MNASRIVALGAALVMFVPLASGGEPQYLDRSEIKKLAGDLMKRIHTPADTRDEVLRRIKKALKSKHFKQLPDTKKIRGMFAYNIGEGGLLVKFKRGSGKADFKGGPSNVKVKFKSTSFGAQAGGSREWGIGLILGLKDPKKFGGPYKGDQRGAIAVESGFSISALTRVDVDVEDGDEYHSVYMIGAAKGLSASAAWAKLTIIPEFEDD